MFHAFSKDQDERNIAPLSKNAVQFFSAIAGSLTFFDKKTSKAANDIVGSDEAKAGAVDDSVLVPVELTFAGHARGALGAFTFA